MKGQMRTRRRNRWASQVVKLGKQADVLRRERGDMLVPSDPEWIPLTDKIERLDNRRFELLNKLKES